jgi:hypothetical protein
MNTIQRTTLEQVEDVQSPEVSVSVKGSRDVAGASELHSELGEIADSFDVTGFKCVHEECGLVHNHDTTKHRASDSFDMTDDESAQMEFNPNCHCGLSELARSGIDGAPTPSEANSMAPVPDSVNLALDGSL